MKQVSYSILAHTEVSVYLTGFRNAQFRSVTLRKSISSNLAPEEKNNFIPPGEHYNIILPFNMCINSELIDHNWVNFAHRP